MALKTTFGDLVDMVRDECRLSTNTSRGIDHLAYIKRLIKRHYYQMAEEFTWEHLNIKHDASDSRVSLAAGSDAYDWPAKLNPLKIEKAWVLWGTIWTPLIYGISYDEYNAFNQDDTTIRSDPVTNWQFYGGDQFQVWPRPGTDHTDDNGYAVAFDGQKKVTQLSVDADQLDMDDMLVSLSVSTEILATTDQKAAAVKEAAFTRRWNTLRANLADKERVTLGMGKVFDHDTHRFPRFIEYVRNA